MTLVSVFREAGQALRFNRQRSILTTISLAWGASSSSIPTAMVFTWRCAARSRPWGRIWC
jgi:hypothetical protein